MRSIHNHKSTSNNKSSGAILFKHRTKPKNSSGRFVILSIIPLLLAVSSNIITYADTTTLTVDNSDTVLELTLPSSLTLDLTPSSTNNYISFGTSNLNILAGTNNPYGLTLTMSVPDTNLTNSSTTITNDETHNPNNIPLDSSNHPIIPTLSSGTTYTENTFTTNTWGYKLSTDTNYSAVPSSLELLNTDSAHNAITTTLNLAAKVDSTRLAGVYSAVLNFATIANAPTLNCNVDLTGCVYYFNDTIDISQYFTYHINFDAINPVGNPGNYNALMVADDGPFSPKLEYGSAMERYNSFNGWIDNRVRTITITGGTDATNPDLITWLQANATQL